jgi:hypothetical protein
MKLNNKPSKKSWDEFDMQAEKEAWSIRKSHDLCSKPGISKRRQKNKQKTTRGQIIINNKSIKHIQILQAD